MCDFTCVKPGGGSTRLLILQLDTDPGTVHVTVTREVDDKQAADGRPTGDRRCISCFSVGGDTVQ